MGYGKGGGIGVLRFVPGKDAPTLLSTVDGDVRNLHEKLGVCFCKGTPKAGQVPKNNAPQIREEHQQGHPQHRLTPLTPPPPHFISFHQGWPGRKDLPVAKEPRE